MENLLNDHKDHSNLHKNSHYDEHEHPFFSLKENHWLLIQQHDQNFLMEGKPL